MDTYRVGAVEQLRRFAALIGVPLAVVSDGPPVAALASHRAAIPCRLTRPVGAPGNSGDL